MATQRQYESATVLNARIVDMRHLWTPSTTYKGQQTQKPNYFSLFIVPKTQQHWSQEPVFADVMRAFGKLLQGQLQWASQNPMGSVTWPIADGDMPSPEGKTSDFAKGHWLYSASTGNAPNVEMVQAGGALAKLQNKVGVKAGDHVMTGITAAVAQNDPRRVKFYLNAVVFTAPGEEIVFANSVSGAELMRMAQQQGLQVAGFSPNPGGFGGPAPQGGFPGGFTPPAGGAPGFTPGGAPGAPMNHPGFVPPGTVPSGTGFGGGAAFPSSPQPGAFPGAPNGFPGR